MRRCLCFPMFWTCLYCWAISFPMLGNSLWLSAYPCICWAPISLSGCLLIGWWYGPDSDRNLWARRDMLRSTEIIWCCFWYRRMRHALSLRHDLLRWRYCWITFPLSDSLSALPMHSLVHNALSFVPIAWYLSWNGR